LDRQLNVRVNEKDKYFVYLGRVSSQKSVWFRRAMEDRYWKIVEIFKSLRGTYSLAELIGELELGTSGEDLATLRDEAALTGSTASELCSVLDEVTK